VLFSFLVLPLSFLPFLVLGFQMSASSQPYISFVDGVGHSTQNLVFVAWEIYAPTDDLISLHGVSLGRTTNNIVEYSAVIELLTDVISFGMLHLVVCLDSQLAVLQLRNVYSI
jgi:ribonuclease HI